MDDCDWLLSVEKACDWLRIEPGVTGNFLLGHPVVVFLCELLMVFYSCITSTHDNYHYHYHDYYCQLFHYPITAIIHDIPLGAG